MAKGNEREGTGNMDKEKAEYSLQLPLFPKSSGVLLGPIFGQSLCD
jgi:hypothetical protein